MTNIHHTITTLIGALLLTVGSAKAQPNVILIFMDDMGYADLSCYGSETINTPVLDQLAAEGGRYTSFLVASSVCTPSRAALLTGCYPRRIGMEDGVLFPGKNKGLNPDEFTIADLFKSQGYATACVGKWHLGDHAETLPRNFGFDSYYGIPYSNDMNHDGVKKPQTNSKSLDAMWRDQSTTLTLWNPPLLRNEEVIEKPVDQRTITRRYTDESLRFIEENKEQRFFLYLAHSMPHIPLYVPEDYYDADPQRAYAQVIQHVDNEVGRIVAKVEELGLTEETYIIFTSDNGPWLTYKHHGGSAGDLRGGKMSSYEGGMRVPCIIKAPGLVPAGTTSDAFMTTMDLLPTFASLIGTSVPAKRPIDGVDLTPVLRDPQVPSPRKELLYYFKRGGVLGYREGNWKILARKPNLNNLALYDLDTDRAESTDLASQHPERVQRMTKRLKEISSELNRNIRPAWKQ